MAVTITADGRISRRFVETTDAFEAALAVARDWRPACRLSRHNGSRFVFRAGRYVAVVQVGGAA